MSSLLNQYHPFRQTIQHGSGPAAAEQQQPRPEASPRSSTNEDDGSASSRFFRRLKTILKLVAAGGLLIGSIWLFMKLHALIHGEETEAAAASRSRSTEEAPLEEGDDLEEEWDYHPAKPKPEKMSTFQSIFCGGHARPAFCKN